MTEISNGGLTETTKAEQQAFLRGIQVMLAAAIDACCENRWATNTECVDRIRATEVAKRVQEMEQSQ